MEEIKNQEETPMTDAPTPDGGEAPAAPEAPAMEPAEPAAPEAPAMEPAAPEAPAAPAEEEGAGTGM